MHRIKTTRKNLLLHLSPPPIFVLETQLTTDVSRPRPLPASSGQSQVLRQERGQIRSLAGELVEISKSPALSQEPLEDRAELGSSIFPSSHLPTVHLPLQLHQTLGFLTWTPPPSSRLPLLIRLLSESRGCTKAAGHAIVCYSFSSPGRDCPSSREAEMKLKQKSLQPVGVPTPPRTCPGWRTIFQIFTSCLAACHRSISLLQSSNLQKYLLYII